MFQHWFVSRSREFWASANGSSHIWPLQSSASHAHAHYHGGLNMCLMYDYLKTDKSSVNQSGHIRDECINLNTNSIDINAGTGIGLILVLCFYPPSRACSPLLYFGHVVDTVSANTKTDEGNSFAIILAISLCLFIKDNLVSALCYTLAELQLSSIKWVVYNRTVLLDQLWLSL